MCLSCEFMALIRDRGIAVQFIEEAVVVPDDVSDELRAQLETAREEWNSIPDRPDDAKLRLVLTPEAAAELWNSGAKAKFTRFADDTPWRP